jgi:protein TonB
MFDFITETTERPLRQRHPYTKVVSAALHVVVVTLVVGIPLLGVTETLPMVPDMLAFVAEAPPAPPPPPPPPPPAPRSAATPSKPVEKPPSEFAAPIEAPMTLPIESNLGAIDMGEGVEGGVEGGIIGGVVGGVVGGLIPATPAPPPPPPPPPPAPKKPVRIGGQITAPALLHRVEPKFPDIMTAAKLEGIVILEAVVNPDGTVESVKVLRSRHPLLDHASVEALKQWRYSPLVLNGIAEPFVLTVTFTFSLK